MKKRLYTLLLLVTLTASAGSTTHIIINSGFTFSPSSITVSLGDTVQFILASVHNAVEVSQATWDGNLTASNGGFAVPFGGGTFVPAEPKQYYYVCTAHAAFGMKGTITVNPATGISGPAIVIPETFSLAQNYPNPFNPSTVIRYTLPSSGLVSLKIYSVLGNEVAALVESQMPQGEYSVEFNGSDLPSGIYLYRLKQDKSVQTRRMVLVK